MHFQIEVAYPYSLREIFDSAARNRVSELRNYALETMGGEKARKQAWHYLCKPRHGRGDERSLFQQSLSSPEGHKQAMNAVGQMMHGMCA